MVLGAEVEHRLRVPYAADERPGEAATARGEVKAWTEAGFSGIPTSTIDPSTESSARYFSTSRAAETVFTIRSNSLRSVLNVDSSEVA